MEPQPTFCHVVVTECPPRVTYCAGGGTGERTECPEPTVCPDTGEQTQCPEEPTRCPPYATQCPGTAPTQCPEETMCPDIHTRCPVVDTMCMPDDPACAPPGSASLVGNKAPPRSARRVKVCPIVQTRVPTII